MLRHIQVSLIVAGCVAAMSGLAGASPSAGFRPPAVPLVTSDPYLSVWSEADHLTDDVTRHWTHHSHPLVSLIRVDGTASRLMGDEPDNVPAMPQVGLEVTPTRSIYQFEDSHVHVTLTFMTAALPDDLEALARPLTYITWSVRSVDGIAHAVLIYDSVSGLLTVNRADEPVTWARESDGSKYNPKHIISGGLTIMRIGTAQQPILGSSGDDHRINWGWAYLAAPARKTQSIIGENKESAQILCRDGRGAGRGRHPHAAPGQRRPAHARRYT